MLFVLSSEVLQSSMAGFQDALGMLPRGQGDKRGPCGRKGAHEFAFCEDIAVDNSASVPGPASQASQAAEVRAERAQTEWVFFRVVGARGRFNQRSFAAR